MQLGSIDFLRNKSDGIQGFCKELAMWMTVLKTIAITAVVSAVVILVFILIMQALM